MKKNNLFKVLGITFLVAVLLTWILPTASYSSQLTIGNRAPVGLYDIFSYPLYALGYFASILLFLLAVGGLYGVLEKTEVYPKLLTNLATKFKGKEKWLLIVSIVLFAILASVTGLNFGLFLVFPFVISVIVAVGYDKLTALAATLGATIVGMFGATFSPSIFKTINSNLGTTYTNEWISKVVLLVLGCALLITFVLMYSKKQIAKEDKKVAEKKKVAVKKNKTKKCIKVNSYLWPLFAFVAILLTLIIARICGANLGLWFASIYSQIILAVLVCGTFIAFVAMYIKQAKKDELGPLYIILGILAVLAIAGSIDFNTAEWFNNLHTKLMALNINGWPIIQRIIGNIPNVSAWLLDSYGNASYNTLSVFTIIASALIALVYKVKFNDLLENFFDGMKKMVLPAALCMMSYAVVIITVYNPVFLNISNFFATITGKFNIATSGFAMLLNSIFNPDLYYYSYNQIVFFADVIEDSALYPLLGMMFTSLHSLMSLIMPTGFLLIASLCYADVSWTKWLKYIWKVFLGLLVIAFITFTVVLLV